MKRNKARASNKTVLGVSMPIELKNKIFKHAQADHRNMAQWCVVQLQKAVRDIEEKDSVPDKK